MDNKTFIVDFLATRQKQGLLRELKDLQYADPVKVLIDGREFINFSSNDYLGLSTHPEVEKTEKEAAQHYSMSYPIGSRIMASNQE